MSSFKPGDWVNIPSLYTDPVQYRSDLCHLGLELWQPKPNEWCWFWNKSFPKRQLLPFRSYFKGSFYSTEYGVTIFNEVLCKCNYFDYCEPFIGQLPTNLKDQS